MVLALYVVAGVMVAGGVLAIYSGSDIIVMERGWTMVISGSVMAASGALLAGIATAVARLQMLEGEFARLSDRLSRPAAPTFSLPSDLSAETLSPERRSAPPLTAPSDIAAHRDLDIAPEPILAPAPAPPAPRVETAPAPSPEGRIEPLDQPGREAAAAHREEPREAAAPESAEEPPPTVVGTYNSGGNFYIMYSDGSIEAETPAGKFRFNSLDELKDFIAAGGDRPKAAAPG
jgi:hypothetical protein